MKQNKISEAVIKRLPKYHRYIRELQARGVERISSSELSAEMGLNASQIRQDFNCFGGFGQQGYGYQVNVLCREIDSILGLTHDYNAVIVGLGNIGKALARYTGFDQERFHIIGSFDINPELIGRKYGNTIVADVAELETFLSINSVDIGIICTQKENAQEICNKLGKSGVKAIWNFAPIDISYDAVFVENVHLSDFLYVLSYRLTNNE